jgi:hypothetical protein
MGVRRQVSSSAIQGRGEIIVPTADILSMFAQKMDPKGEGWG